MQYIEQFFSNKLLICAIVGWLSAQIIKLILVLLFDKKLDWERLIGSGGMPSSHSAFVCALTTSAGIVHGLDSGIFAVCFVLAFIVMYDAAGVRRAAGEQAKVINLLARHIKMEEPQMDVLKELLGHTLPEVIAGAILGVVISILILL